jgi:hypothetical protein
VTAFVVRRLIVCGLLTELSGTPDGYLINPDQVDAVCRREDLAVLLGAKAPLVPHHGANSSVAVDGTSRAGRLASRWPPAGGWCARGAG